MQLYFFSIVVCLPTNRETRLVRQVLLGADVILSTLTSTGQDGALRHLPEHHVTLTVIDECSQVSCIQYVLIWNVKVM